MGSFDEGTLVRVRHGTPIAIPSYAEPGAVGLIIEVVGDSDWKLYCISFPLGVLLMTSSEIETVQ